MKKSIEHIQMKVYKEVCQSKRQKVASQKFRLTGRLPINSRNRNNRYVPRSINNVTLLYRRPEPANFIKARSFCCTQRAATNPAYFAKRSDGQHFSSMG